MTIPRNKKKPKTDVKKSKNRSMSLERFIHRRRTNSNNNNEKSDGSEDEYQELKT